MKLEDVIIDLYLRIDRIYREIVCNQRLRQRAFDPALSEASACRHCAVKGEHYSG